MYKHGNYAVFNMDEAHEATTSKGNYAPVYVGALPVHTVAGGGANVNKPILLTDFASAVKAVGYTDDWENYDLCEALYTHFVLAENGPIVVINVFNPATKKKSKETTVQATANQAILGNMGNVILDSFVVTGKTRDVDYTLAYDYVSERIILRGLRKGALEGSLSITYDEVTPGIEAVDVIGDTDNEGTNSGLYLIRHVYQETGKIPTRLLCPGFSHIPTVHEAMETVCNQIGGHFDVFMFSDLPLQNDASEALKPSSVAAWKESKGYNRDNEKTHWPRWAGVDGRLYHLSVLDAANLQTLENAANELPYQTASNTAILISGKPYYGEGISLVLDEELVDETLGQYGITSAVYHGGKWVLWGSHCASYVPGNANALNLYESTLMMMYHLANDFQIRRADEIDKVVSVNRIQQIAAEEQANLDALVAVGALLYGKAYFVLNDSVKSDMLAGDFAMRWEITQNINIKSITGTVQRTDEGLVAYYDELIALNE